MAEKITALLRLEQPADPETNMQAIERIVGATLASIGKSPDDLVAVFEGSQSLLADSPPPGVRIYCLMKDNEIMTIENVTGREAEAFMQQQGGSHTLQ